ncbi:hypothetical protein RD792_017311 [Penstemon davidsonii]|uniref:BTB domain-containing protein n=1 Tax=Penstemon davidsonii TaxID=160366 RepID=A0ABR0CNG2_9LAMI|nr:hypothetical protein RD792_017311 [Penstemon davidsonii]
MDKDKRWMVGPYCPYTENIHSRGYYDFYKRTELEASQFIKDDCLTIQCTVGVLKTSMDCPKTLAQPLPLSDLGESYMQLLESREGSDVTFEVEGEIFYAHKLILATRSPVFRAQFCGPLKEENTRCIKIEEMHAPVFKALLYFIYCHVIPDLDSKCVDTIMTHLLAAADRYGIERLKSLCEARLRENIAIDTVVSTLAFAEQHGCFQLKSICLEFIGLPKNLKDIMQTDGFKNLKENCPTVIDELFKSVAQLRDNEPGIKELESFSCYRGVAHICGSAKRLLFRFLCTRHALKYMGESASIVNTTSVQAYLGSPSSQEYQSTKGAIMSFTRGLALQLIPRGILVNGVVSGPVLNPVQVVINPEDKITSLGSETPMGRAGQSHEVALCFVFLAFEESSYYTGQILHPHGGMIVNG